MRPTRLLALAFAAAPLHSRSRRTRRMPALVATPPRAPIPFRKVCRSNRSARFASRRTSEAGCRSTSAPTARRSCSITSAISTRCRSPAEKRRRSRAAWRWTRNRASVPTANASCSFPIAAARRISGSSRSTKKTRSNSRASGTQSFDSPEWTPDGKYILGSRGNNLMMYHVEGGSGVQIGAPPPNAPAAAGGTRQRGDESALHRRRVRQRPALHLGLAAQHEQPVGVQRSISQRLRHPGLRSRDRHSSA